MIYISIPVHEKPEVVVNQMQNFARYLPEAKVVLHVSKGAKFSVNELENVLKNENVSHVLVNPTQVETKWGSIIQAHLANIRYIIQQGDAEKVIFHSSNDMLIMDGLSEYLQDKKNIFHLRKCTSDSLWWVARRALKDNEISTFFNNEIYASQIEGSMYDISLLKSLVHNIDNRDLILDSEFFYPREEVIFSSFACKEDIKPDGLPYVYSEIHNFDRCFFKYIEVFMGSEDYKQLFNYLPGIGIDYLKMYVSKVIDFFKSYKIELAGLTTVYNFDRRYNQYIKPIDAIKYLSKLRNEDFELFYDGFSSYLAKKYEIDNITQKELVYILRYYFKKYGIKDHGISTLDPTTNVHDKLHIYSVLKRTDDLRRLIKKEVLIYANSLRLHHYAMSETFDRIRPKVKDKYTDNFNITDHVYVSQYDSDR